MTEDKYKEEEPPAAPHHKTGKFSFELEKDETEEEEAV